jgi:hypothetical protein
VRFWTKTHYRIDWIVDFAVRSVNVGLGAVRQTRTRLSLPNPTRVSGRKQGAPLGESGGTGLLEVLAV